MSRQSSATDEVPIIAELNTGARSSVTPLARRVTSAAPAAPSTASPMSALMSTPAATLASEAGLFTPNIESINVTVPPSTDTPNGHAPAGKAMLHIEGYAPKPHTGNLFFFSETDFIAEIDRYDQAA